MKKILASTNFQMIVAIVAGLALGVSDPVLALTLKPVASNFIEVFRYLIVPVLFFNLMACLAKTRRVGELGELGLKTLIYFEVMSVLAIAGGMLAATLFAPGRGFHILQNTAQDAVVALTMWQTLKLTFLNSSHLQVLSFSLLLGLLLLQFPRRSQGVFSICEQCSVAVSKLVYYCLKLIPVAAFAAVAYSVGKLGLESVQPLLEFVALLYLGNVLFIVLVFWPVLYCCHASFWQLLVDLREELLIVVGTSSSLTAMPRLIDKMARRSEIATLAPIVIPLGYSFNLSGSNFYLGFALVFLAQASGVDLNLAQYGLILLLTLVTSKGATAVPGSALMVVTASIIVIPQIANEGLLYLLAIERLLKCRPLTNLLGHAVACLAISRWIKAPAPGLAGRAEQRAD